MVTKVAVFSDVQCYCNYLLFREVVQSVQLKADQVNTIYKPTHRVVHQQSVLHKAYFNRGAACFVGDNIIAA